ncbi:TetR/AcrR family transcriptional regulator [Siculibacillus lacustris]|uniref:TetR/AcrR family transcriptional regulator n=1 Tax=Siculibacillus lacustris TaxID=1549641 RepID=A0A4Q9VP16_9HYPH|nr:TetR/AcrR family transcriptional regulator [Siculibacillus lacustris]TBW37422.1 TetR/AcrR family transcriptional regulator [Siculibacillus lacustris]
MPSTSNEMPLRADARRNRERLLAAAEELFSEQGAATTFDDVAKRAKVGIGTLYRRFPTREALLAAMCDERLLAIAEAGRAREGRCDPVGALRVFIEELVAATNVYRGLAASLGTVLGHPTRGCAATTEQGRRLLHRAQTAGVVRPDVSMDDLICVITAVALATAEASDPAARITHLVGLFLDGAVESRARR